MPRNDDNTEQLNIVIPRGKRKVITALADRDGLKLSEYIRLLIENDAKKKQSPVDLKLEHGGHRKQTA